MHVQPLFGLRMRPAAEYASAGKNQRMGTILVNHGEFKIPFEWRTRDGLPHFLKSGQHQRPRFDLNHIATILLGTRQRATARSVLSLI
jgi:hypothetical protein